MAIWVIKDGQREGPYEERDVRELVYEGTYSDSDPAIRDGQLDWTTLGRILRRQPPASGGAPVGSTTMVPPPPPHPTIPPEPLPAPAMPAPNREVSAPDVRPEPPPVAAFPAPEPPPLAASPAPAPPELPGSETQRRPIQVAVVDFEMPFGSMVLLMVKWVLACIPALFILGAIAGIIWTMLFALFAVVAHR